MSGASRKLLVGLLLLLLVSATALLFPRKHQTPAPPGPSPQVNPEFARAASQLQSLEAEEDKVNRTIWAKEMLAEECGRRFESFWDSLNAATNKFKAVKAFSAGAWIVGTFNQPRSLPHGIELHEPTGARRDWSDGQWRRFLDEMEAAGWQIVQAEFRHTRFETDKDGRPRQSHFDFRADLINPGHADRATLEGTLLVDWSRKPPGAEFPAVERIDASQLLLKTRHGEPPFREILNTQIQPPEKSYFIDPLILYDLDGDGLSEIILAAKNLVLHRSGPDRYEAGPLLRYPRGLIFTGVIADFDGDGVADFLCANIEGLVLFKGSPQGTFDEPGRLVWAANPHLIYGQVLTCGDIQHDGHLDVFLGQYKVPYRNGQMPDPYYDANDGFPSYLLQNDGHGNFTDITESAGLGGKRWRRAYSSSFVDLDDDGHLDLMVVSDFAGVDLYRNDGRGHFIDATHEWVGESHAFGMGHALTDFNADGRLDLLMIGMNSPTADRLEHLGLTRSGTDGERAMRSRVTFGNRLYLGRAGGGFAPTGLNDSIARSGWSWGCSAFDFDNDGYPDVYIANGQKTKPSVRDYDSEFWLHDIYVGTSREDTVANAYFQTKFRRLPDQSYGGYEKNRLYLNQHGESFLEAGFLTGVAMPQDSRAVVADDLDGDGRVDLLVTTFEAWPETRQTLHIYQNVLEDGGNWIGFRFREESGGPSPVGARVTVHGSGFNAIRQIVTGDSYRSQHAGTVHFGLGQASRVDHVEIQWANGQTRTLTEPAVNQYHTIHPPIEGSAHP